MTLCGGWTISSQYPVLQVRDLCFEGEYKQKEVVISPHVTTSAIVPDSYAAAGKSPGIAKEKRVTCSRCMTDGYPSPDRRLEVLPPPMAQPAPPPAAVDEPVTSQLAQQHQLASKQKRCPVENCNGSGHKNIGRRASGHTTRNGCPLYYNVAPPMPT